MSLSSSISYFFSLACFTFAPCPIKRMSLRGEIKKTEGEKIKNKRKRE